MGQSKRIFEEQRQHEEQTQSNNALAIRDAEFRLLYRYSIWLEKEGYMDTDFDNGSRETRYENEDYYMFVKRK